MIILSEYDAFKKITEGLSQAAEGADLMATHRPDVGHMWAKMAETFRVCRESAYKLSEEAPSRTLEK